MSKAHEAGEEKEEEALPLTVSISGATEDTHVDIGNEPGAASFCDDQHHRKLAYCSIICGLSCIGITALINSVKAETAEDAATAAPFLKRAKKFGILSIVVWVAILTLTPVLIVLVSYLLTLGD